MIHRCTGALFGFETCLETRSTRPILENTFRASHRTRGKTVILFGILTHGMTSYLKIPNLHPTGRFPKGRIFRQLPRFIRGSVTGVYNSRPSVPLKNHYIPLRSDLSVKSDPVCRRGHCSARGRGRGRTMSTTDEDPDKMVKNSWTPEVRSLMPSRVPPARDASGARGTPLNRREVISLLPRLREEGRRRAASRSIAIETPKSASRVHPAHCPHPQTQEDALLREQIDKHGGPGNWTAIAEALVGRSSKSCRLRCARPRTHPRARDAAGIDVRSPRAPPVISRRAARAFPGLILERRPPPPPRVPSRPFPFSNQPLAFVLAFVPILVIPSEHTQVVQPAQPHGEARAVHRRGGQGNPRRACRVRQQVGGHLPRHPRQVRQRRARPAAHAQTKIQHARHRFARFRSVLSSRRR